MENFIFKELDESDAKTLISQEFNKILILSGKKMISEDFEVHCSFIYEYFMKHCSMMSLAEIETFFEKFNNGDIVDKIFPNSRTIIDALKTFKNKNSVKGTEFSSNHADYGRSKENIKRVKESLKTKVIDPKALYTSEELLQIDPEYAEMKRETARKAKANVYKMGRF